MYPKFRRFPPTHPRLNRCCKGGRNRAFTVYQRHGGPKGSEERVSSVLHFRSFVAEWTEAEREIEGGICEER
jgi:hypothetical protein